MTTAAKIPYDSARGPRTVRYTVRAYRESGDSVGERRTFHRQTAEEWRERMEGLGYRCEWEEEAKAGLGGRPRKTGGEYPLPSR